MNTEIKISSDEFTIHQGMRDQMLRWGYLAQYYGHWNL